MPLWKIGVISDTHGLLCSQAKEVLQGCDLIIHAGDIDNPSLLGELKRIAPTTAVRGNMDGGSWANSLRIIERVQVGDWSMVVIHKVDDLPSLDEDTDIVIFGHSHKFLQETRDGILFLNPGSAGPRRFFLPMSMAILSLGETVTVEQVILASKA